MTIMRVFILLVIIHVTRMKFNWYNSVIPCLYDFLKCTDDFFVFLNCSRTKDHYISLQNTRQTTDKSEIIPISPVEELEKLIIKETSYWLKKVLINSYLWCQKCHYRYKWWRRFYSTYFSKLEILMYMYAHVYFMNLT